MPRKPERKAARASAACGPIAPASNRHRAGTAHSPAPRPRSKTKVSEGSRRRVRGSLRMAQSRGRPGRRIVPGGGVRGLSGRGRRSAPAIPMEPEVAVAVEAATASPGAAAGRDSRPPQARSRARAQVSKASMRWREKPSTIAPVSARSKPSSSSEVASGCGPGSHASRGAASSMPPKTSQSGTSSSAQSSGQASRAAAEAAAVAQDRRRPGEGDRLFRRRRRRRRRRARSCRRRPHAALSRAAPRAPARPRRRGRRALGRDEGAGALVRGAPNRFGESAPPCREAPADRRAAARSGASASGGSGRRRPWRITGAARATDGPCRSFEPF